MKGQIITRGPYSGPDGRKVWIVLGLVEDDTNELRPETQYTLAMGPVLCNPVDVSKHTIGESPSGILRAPIWRI